MRPLTHEVAVHVPFPENEIERLQALAQIDILDSEAEAFFDDIVALASQFAHAPITLISLVDECRQWFKAKVGIDIDETPREISFCAYAILGTDPFIVEDATKDERFASNPLVIGDPHVRAYAGVPLVTRDGFALGTLCAIRPEVGPWTDQQIDALTRLAGITIRHMELRKAEREAAWLREVEDQLAKAETRFQALLTNMSEGLVVQVPGGAITWVNKAAERILGLSADEMYGRTSVDPRWRAVQEDGSDFPGEQHFSMQALNTGKPHSGIMGVEQPNRERRWLQVHAQPMNDTEHGSVSQVVTTFLDITADRENQLQLENSERHLKLALTMAKAVAWEVDLSTGRTIASDTMYDLFGRDISKGSLANFWGVIYPPDFESVQTAWVKTIRQKGVFDEEYRVVDANGQPRWVRSYALAHYRATDGKADRFSGVFIDINNAKQQEAQLAEAAALAEAANAAEGSFLANMSHEIRTPLNGVVGLTGALRKTNLQPKQREMVDLIYSSGHMLERLLSDILDVSKAEAGQFQLEVAPFNLRDEIEAAAHLMRVRADERGIGFEVNYAGSVDGRFEGDAVRLKQVVSNLVSNAIKFTEKGSVSVGVRIDDAADNNSSWLTLEVVDTGIGFDDLAAATLFQRFTQADATITRRFGGTGLGLSICRTIAELMGGTIEAKSKPGQGSTFTVQAPLSRASISQNTLAQSTAISSRLEAHDGEEQGLRILVAEDHPTNQKVIELLLEPTGVALTITADGAACVEAYKVGAFDLILMDMQMPIMDGLEATAEIRRLERLEGRAYTPIAMLSANALTEHRERATAIGADGYIAKPIHADSLFEGIEITLESVAQRFAA
mgnify:CR=1 FL=1